MSDISQEEVYEKFSNYDWDSFTEFQQGLSEILDNYLQGLKERDPSVTSIPGHEKNQLVNQAKSFFFCDQTGHILSLDDYNEWLAKKGQLSNDDTGTLSIDSSATDDPNAPPYSSNYQEIVELIVQGKPIPGIKEIPNTILSEKASNATAKQRTKPWETKNESATNSEES